MKIRGLLRCRNEELIIQETLDHFSQICDEIYVYDDCSTDKTLDIVKDHFKVKGYIVGEEWDTDRERAEWQNRQAVYELAQENAEPEDWFIYFDADERIDYKSFDKSVLDGQADYIVMDLFDFYITPEDEDKVYNGDLISLRDKIGPEYREILMMFRQKTMPRWHLPDQRIPTLQNPFSNGIKHGYVRHYGKCISKEHWNNTCDYYANHFPKYSEKWSARRGKAVHKESDFGRPLITWDEREEKGVLL